MPLSNKKQKRKAAIIIDNNRKPKTKLKQIVTVEDTKTEKNAVFKCENRKTETNIGQIRKTENPNVLLLE